MLLFRSYNVRLERSLQQGINSLLPCHSTKIGHRSIAENVRPCSISRDCKQVVRERIGERNLRRCNSLRYRCYPAANQIISFSKNERRYLMLF